MGTAAVIIAESPSRASASGWSISPAACSITLSHLPRAKGA